jgi:ParB-like chromosome segregation protein Spo0J
MELSQIPLSNITPNPENPRGIKIDTQDPKLSYLKDSIAQFGVLVPLVVTPRVGNYLLVDGGTTPRKRLD